MNNRGAGYGNLPLRATLDGPMSGESERLNESVSLLAHTANQAFSEMVEVSERPVREIT